MWNKGLQKISAVPGEEGTKIHIQQTIRSKHDTKGMNLGDDNQKCLCPKRVCYPPLPPFKQLYKTEYARTTERNLLCAAEVKTVCPSLLCEIQHLRFKRADRGTNPSNTHPKSHLSASLCGVFVSLQANDRILLVNHQLWLVHQCHTGLLLTEREEELEQIKSAHWNAKTTRLRYSVWEETSRWWSVLWMVRERNLIYLSASAVGSKWAGLAGHRLGRWLGLRALSITLNNWPKTQGQSATNHFYYPHF